MFSADYYPRSQLRLSENAIDLMLRDETRQMSEERCCTSLVAFLQVRIHQKCARTAVSTEACLTRNLP